MTRRSLSLVVAALFVASCGSYSTTAPTPPAAATPTRVITLFGNLAFGDVEVGTTQTRYIEIRNDGNQPLTITGVFGQGGVVTANVVPDWSKGTIQPGQTQKVNLFFTPPAVASYVGVFMFGGDQTSGTNTIAFSGNGVRTGAP